MEFVELPAELTTATTDALLALLALGGAALLLRQRGCDRFQAGVWAAAFLCLALASAAPG
jgi:MYXO-CTERM domain-containing protein